MANDYECAAACSRWIKQASRRMGHGRMRSALRYSMRFCNLKYKHCNCTRKQMFCICDEMERNCAFSDIDGNNLKVNCSPGHRIKRLVNLDRSKIEVTQPLYAMVVYTYRAPRLYKPHTSQENERNIKISSCVHLRLTPQKIHKVANDDYN